MYILKPHIFEKYPEIIFGFSTKISSDCKAPYYFNLSYSVGDDKDTVDKNRGDFFKSLGLSVDNVGYQRQIHSDIIQVIGCGGDNGASDALITDKKNLGIAIAVADCTPIFIYDKKNKVIAAVHSGWKGTEQKILLKTLLKLHDEFKSNPENMICYIGPSISKANYEVGSEVAELFDKSFSKPNGKKFLLDVSGINYNILKNFGIPENQIQKSKLCTFEYENLLHSYRRDGNLSGRSIGVIAIKE
ncbi:MAG: peptidoglycan editing factor PgeF [Ignavibacteriales bacterium]|nr:peptidoglycan editing factor PgeF [Ignavibacteriales bacterium]